MKLTLKSHYVLRSILDLALYSNEENPVKLYDISERQNISLFYLEQLFRRLRIAGLVKSVRGPGGGYILGKSPKEISIKEILESVGENLLPGIEKKLADDEKLLTKEYKITKTFFQKLDYLNKDYFQKTLLSHLLEPIQSHRINP